MMRQGGSRLAGSTAAVLGARLFSHSATAGASARGLANGKYVLAGIMNRNATSGSGKGWIAGVRNFSAVAQQQQQQVVENGKPSITVAENAKEKKEIASYWGVPSGKVVKKDGTEWRWTCFRVKTLKYTYF
jgi:hypothetical protein